MKAFIAFFLYLCCSVVYGAQEEKFCSWEHPGTNKYQKNPIEALDDYYMDFRVRALLRSRMETHQYDDIVEIRRDGVKGSDGWTYSNLRDMHYGKGSYCPGPVDTLHWNPAQVERALVYCVDTVCIAVPTVCNNVSLIDRDSQIELQPSAGSPEGPIGTPQPSLDQGPSESGQQPGPTSDQGGGQEIPGTQGGGVGSNPSGSFGGGGGDLGGGSLPPGHPASGPSCGCVIPPPPPPVCPPPVVPPIHVVPEPPEWIMILAGLISFVYLWGRRRK